jgi:hypothetical protein
MGREVLDNIRFVQAKHFTELSPGRHIQLIVIHSMEAPEKGSTAEAVAQYFADGAGGRPASAHYCIDNNSIVQCVQTRDIAFAAPNANRNGIHLEHAGYARQTKAQWLDEFSLAMLKNSAWLCGRVLTPKYRIPVQFLNARDLKRARVDTDIKGFTTHAEVTKAFNSGGHTDPGKGFPVREYLTMVMQAVAGSLK